MPSISHFVDLLSFHITVISQPISPGATSMLFRLPLYASFIVWLGLSPTCLPADGAAPASLNVLLVAGGCCHDYATQTKLLKAGIEQRIRAEVTVVYNPSKGTDTTFEIYESSAWAEGYDVVIHDECSANVTDRPYIDRILDAHKSGVPAVNLHCAMHSYRWGDFRQPVAPGAHNFAWYEMIGVQSTGHGPQSPIAVTYTEDQHPIVNGLQDWTTINEELYNNVRVYDGTQALANGRQVQQPSRREREQNPNAQPRESEAVVVWTNEYGPHHTKIFSTTLGHNNETVADPRYLDLVTRGILWTTGHLTDEGQADPAYANARP
jgi:type 1 glutamine amidotransferase